MKKNLIYTFSLVAVHFLPTFSVSETHHGGRINRVFSLLYFSIQYTRTNGSSTQGYSLLALVILQLPLLFSLIVLFKDIKSGSIHYRTLRSVMNLSIAQILLYLLISYQYAESLKLFIPINCIMIFLLVFVELIRNNDDQNIRTGGKS